MTENGAHLLVASSSVRPYNCPFLPSCGFFLRGSCLKSVCYCGCKQPGAVAWISLPPTPCSHPATLDPLMRPSWGQSWGSQWGGLTPCSHKPGVFCFSSNPITTVRLPRLEYVCSPHCSLAAISQRGFKFNWPYSNTTPTHNMLVPLGFRKPPPPHTSSFCPCCQQLHIHVCT